MKKLNLLKPDKRTLYLNHGKGQEVNYLHISEDLTLASLEQDVKAGAALFKDTLETASRKPSQFVVIKSKSEEEGLMAVSYLAGTYNSNRRIPEEDEADELWNCEKETKELDIEDFEKDFSLDFEEDCEDASEDWCESPYRIPIITLQQLRQYTNMTFSHMHMVENNYFVNGVAVNPPKEPYWLSATRESVCILVKSSDTNSRIFGYDPVTEGLCYELKRFESNKHVYVVIVSEEDVEEDEEGEKVPVVSDPEDYIDFVMIERQAICEIVLEYTAILLEVKCNKEALIDYHVTLFENWAEEMEVSLAKDFPVREMAVRVTAIRNKNKSELMEKVYKFVLAQDGVGTVLCSKDFEIIKKFRLLGLDDEPGNENKSIQKMEQSLVGLEDVKKQIYSIVNVMKYNKKRALLGFGKGGFHNVHMMIGAPGTAKTTIAKLMGNIMKEQKLLKDNKFIAINGADLKGMFVGHSAPKTKAYFDKYDIILIDEAYSMATGNDMDSFSEEAIAQLIIELEKHGMDKLVIFAGYGGKDVSAKDNKMLQFLNANPGIRSRINSTIYFESYNPKQMVDIVYRQAKNGNFKLAPEAEQLIYDYFETRYQLPDFGNGREARSLLENIAMQAASRIMPLSSAKHTKKAMQELTYEDVEAAIQFAKQANEMQQGRQATKCGFRMEEV